MVQLNQTGNISWTGNQGFSFSYWIKSDTTHDVTGDGHSIPLYIKSTAGYYLSVWLMDSADGAAGQYRFYSYNGVGVTGSSTVIGAITSRWHHIAGVRNASGQSIFIDGQHVETNTSLVDMSGHTLTTINLGSNFKGSLDEVAIWSRALTAAEVLQLYRRGANRLKYQFRSCVDSTCACKSLSTSPAGSASDCDGDGTPNSTDTSDSHLANWIGPDGTTSTYFSELHNNDAINTTTGLPAGDVKATGLDLSFSLFPTAAQPIDDRYFQYRVYMESDDENDLCSGSLCMPEITSISIGPTGRFYAGSPTIVNNSSVSLSEIKSMTKSDNNSCTNFQISTDSGSTWNWWDASANSGSGGWAVATNEVQYSSPISDITTERLQTAGGGNFKFKAFFKL